MGLEQCDHRNRSAQRDAVLRLKDEKHRGNQHGMAAKLAILTEGPSTKYPETNYRMEIIDLIAGAGKD
jgi:hypothetical protein